MTRRLSALGFSLAVAGADLAVALARRVLGRPAPRRGVVLYYHAVRPAQRQRFARQLDILRARAAPFPAGSPEAMTGRGRHAAVTFDDGFRSVADQAVPELTARSIPFTVFVPSGCLGERPSWVRDRAHASWDERVLSAAELRALAGLPLAAIGSHAVTHRDLRRLSREAADRELTASKATLEAATGAAIDLFSFPHGAHDEELVELARAAGYRRVFTIEPAEAAPDSAEFAVGRVAADPDDWPIEFLLKIAGAYRWRHWIHRLRRAA